MENIERKYLKKYPKVSSDKSFGVVFSIFFFIISLNPLFITLKISFFTFLLSFIMLIVAIFSPKKLSPANLLWLKIGYFMHTLLSPLFLGLLFFLLITPIGIITKIFRIESLLLSRKPNIDTYWIARIQQSPTSKTLKDQF